MNEEKDPKWFVWERNIHGACSAAIYRGMPQTGTGKAADDQRFVLRKQLSPEEQHLTIDQLKVKYPCPAGEISKHEPRQKADLSRNGTTTEQELPPLSEFRGTSYE